MKTCQVIRLAVLCMLVMSSCKHNQEDLFDPVKAEQYRNNRYNKAFEEVFGEIAPDNNWGFGESSYSRMEAYKEKRDWKKFGLKVPASIGENEKQRVNEWFATHRNPTSISLDLNEFWIQHVCAQNVTSETHYRIDGTTSGQNVNFRLDQLSVGGQGIVNDFNSTYGPLTFIRNCSASDFSFFNNYDSKRSDEYPDSICSRPLYTIQEIDGAYYVGFDIFGYKREGDGSYKIEGEETAGYYNDWILKLVPARRCRIIAEDLGTIGDFDFNDVVFDVVSFATQSDQSAELQLQAVGGSMPLYLSSVNDPSVKLEVHDLFGVGLTTFINTGLGETAPPVTFYLKGVQSAADVVITVGDGRAAYEVKAFPGEAPQKMCVGTDFQWSQEFVSISDTYSNFIYYVCGLLPEDEWY